MSVSEVGLSGGEVREAILSDISEAKDHVFYSRQSFLGLGIQFLKSLNVGGELRLLIDNEIHLSLRLVICHNDSILLTAFERYCITSFGGTGMRQPTHSTVT
ncbi:MAG: hypothetical protein ACXW36_11395, partial [Nitrospira sp.]